VRRRNVSLGISAVGEVGRTEQSVSDQWAADAGTCLGPSGCAEENKFKDSATTAKQGPVVSLADAINSAGQGAYSAYREKAKDVAVIFTAETGIVVGDASLDPALA
jgi:hypothetical protein